jgi:hypothetical protein
MARTLHFQATQIGDGIVAISVDHQPQTPASVHVGLYQAAAAIDASSVNLLYAMEVAVHWLKSTPQALALAAQAVQVLVNRTGDVLVKDGGSTVLRGVNWTLVSAPRPETRPGFGGRFLDAWVLRFEGESALRSS